MTALSKCIIVFLLILSACEVEPQKKLSKRKSDGGSDRGAVTKVSVLCIRQFGNTFQGLVLKGQNKSAKPGEDYYVIPGGKVEETDQFNGTHPYDEETTLMRAGVRELIEEAYYVVEQDNLKRVDKFSKDNKATVLYISEHCQRATKDQLRIFFKSKYGKNEAKIKKNINTNIDEKITWKAMGDNIKIKDDQEELFEAGMNSLIRSKYSNN